MKNEETFKKNILRYVLEEYREYVKDQIEQFVEAIRAKGELKG